MLSQKLIDLYKRDSLTGFYQRKALSVEYDQMVEKAKKSSHEIGVMLVDLDGLKYINDTFGHTDGDKAIKVVSQAMKEAMPNEAMLFRYGGDELLAIFVKDGEISPITEAIHRNLTKYMEENKPPYIIGASIGCAVDSELKEKNLRELISIADELMYTEKNAKKAAKNDGN